MNASASPHPTASAAAARIVDWYETLDRAALARIDAIYAPDAAFKDPFNEVRGIEAIRRVFEHMFRTLGAPRFVVQQRVGAGDQLFLTWHFRFERSGGRSMTIRGASHLQLGEDGRITMHRDYWDAAEELYEQLPLLGALMRVLRRRLRAP